MTNPKHVLLVEDDLNIAEIVLLHLRDEGYAVAHATDGQTGLALLQSRNWDALVLDLMLPNVNGLDICRQAREMAHYTPIIITSARSSEVHRIVGLEVGADDYLAKPFSVLELVARVKALVRRVDTLRRDARQNAGQIIADDLSIDPITREVTVKGRPVELTLREFDLLHFFACHPGTVFSRIKLLNEVWGYQHDGYEHTVNTHINRLRAKIEDDPTAPAHILTVWGVGYKFVIAGAKTEGQADAS